MGYSGADEHLNQFIWRAIERSELGVYPSYWITPGSIQPTVLERFNELGGQHIPLEALAFFGALGLPS